MHDMEAVNDTEQTFPVYVDTNLDTHFIFAASPSDTVATIRSKIAEAHFSCSPHHGEVVVSALKVKKKSTFYHLMDSLVFEQCFRRLNNVPVIQAEISPVLCSEMTPLVLSRTLGKKNIKSLVGFQQPEESSSLPNIEAASLPVETVQADHVMLKKHKKLKRKRKELASEYGNPEEDILLTQRKKRKKMKSEKRVLKSLSAQAANNSNQKHDNVCSDEDVKFSKANKMPDTNLDLAGCISSIPDNEINIRVRRREEKPKKIRNSERQSADSRKSAHRHSLQRKSKKKKVRKINRKDDLEGLPEESVKNSEKGMVSTDVEEHSIADELYNVEKNETIQVDSILEKKVKKSPKSNLSLPENGGIFPVTDKSEKNLNSNVSDDATKANVNEKNNVKNVLTENLEKYVKTDVVCEPREGALGGANFTSSNLKDNEDCKDAVTARAEDYAYSSTDASHSSETDTDNEGVSKNVNALDGHGNVSYASSSSHGNSSKSLSRHSSETALNHGENILENSSSKLEAKRNTNVSRDESGSSSHSSSKGNGCSSPFDSNTDGIQKNIHSKSFATHSESECGESENAKKSQDGVKKKTGTKDSENKNMDSVATDVDACVSSRGQHSISKGKNKKPFVHLKDSSLESSKNSKHSKKPQRLRSLFKSVNDASSQEESETDSSSSSESSDGHSSSSDEHASGVIRNTAGLSSSMKVQSDQSFSKKGIQFSPSQKMLKSGDTPIQSRFAHLLGKKSGLQELYKIASGKTPEPEKFDDQFESYGANVVMLPETQESQMPGRDMLLETQESQFAV